MRMVNDDMVDEILWINAIPAWLTAAGESEENPGIYAVQVGTYTVAEGFISQQIGEYKLDGTVETFNEAKKNYKMIVDQIAKEGWFSLDQFENFEVY